MAGKLVELRYTGNDKFMKSLGWLPVYPSGAVVPSDVYTYWKYYGRIAGSFHLVYQNVSVGKCLLERCCNTYDIRKRK